MTAPIRRARINHLEVTVAAGTLTALMPDLAAFYGDALGSPRAEGWFPVDPDSASILPFLH